MPKIVFMGTPEFSVPILEMLISEGYDIVLVVTQPDKIVGRKKVLMKSKVKEVALNNNIPLFQPVKLRHDYQTILDSQPDLLITAAYGQILPKGLLDKVKAINVHGSLLPKYRGGAPIQYALFDGVTETGITLMEMAYTMDSGDIIAQDSLKIADEDNYTTLSKKLSHLGMTMLKAYLPAILNHDYIPQKQNEDDVTFAYNIKRNEEFLDFSNSVTVVLNKIRGLSLEPGASFIAHENFFKVYKAKKSDIIKDVASGTIITINKRLVIACADGSVEIEVIQQQGKKILDIRSFLNGQNILKENDYLERIEDGKS